MEGLKVLLVPWLLLLTLHETVGQTDSERIDQLNETLKLMVRQSILQQLHVEQQTMSNGHSGIKQIRLVRDGTRPYFSASHTDGSVFGIHGHANTDRTVGLGELTIVLNGVEFRTRHNDYHLSKPNISGDYGATEEIEFPSVPPAVLAKSTVDEQIQEMREWFNAWQTQDYSERDYRDYFKPIICYAEGAWTSDDDEYVDEPYYSTRHFIGGETWYELEEQIRYETNSGDKQSHENSAYLPKVVIDVTDEGRPVFAQWNYRILCQPLSFDLPLKQLRVIDELKSRLLTKMSLENYAKNSPRARFQVLPEDLDPLEETETYNWLLEKIMNEVPGMGGPGSSSLTEDGYNGLVSDPITFEPVKISNYHRAYVSKLRARFGAERRRGFSDSTLFMAQTTHEKVVPMTDIRCATAKRRFTCDSPQKRWTYAIPLEIIYMTPLLSWNPYDITYKGDADSDYGSTVYDDDANGSKSKPYKGSNSKSYLHLPHAFYNDDAPDPDDEFPPGGFYVLNSTGQANAVMASGTLILLPKIIPGQATEGRVRIRYPIAPIHGEGSGVWKELEALKDVILKPDTYKFAYETTTNSKGSSDTTLTLGPSSDSEPHTHTLTISGDAMQSILEGGEEVVTTDQANQHSHKLKLRMDASATDCESKIVYKRCDSKLKCFDGHPKCLLLETTAK